MRSLFSSLNSFFLLLVLTHSLLSSGKRDFTQVASRKGKTKPGGFHGHTDPASYLSFCPRFSIFLEKQGILCPFQMEVRSRVEDWWQLEKFKFEIPCGQMVVACSPHLVRGGHSHSSRWHRRTWVSGGAAVFSDVTCLPPPKPNCH